MEKIIKYCKNFKNVTKTLSEKHQETQCFNENNYLSVVQAIDASEYCSGNYGDDVNAVIDQYFPKYALYDPNLREVSIV